MISLRLLATSTLFALACCVLLTLQAQHGTALGSAGAHPGGTPSAVSHPDGVAFANALELYDAGNLTAARPVLLQLAAKYPNHEKMQAAAGMSLAEGGEVQRALPYLRRAHRLAPQDNELTANLAVALLKVNAAAEAVTLLQVAAKQQPASAALQLYLAQAQMQDNQAADAAASYGTTANLLQQQGQPVEDDLRHDWAVALLAANDAAQAVRVLQSAPDQADSANLQELLADAEERSQHYEAAAQHFKRAAQLDPSESNLYSYSAELMRHWTFPAAIEVLTYALTRFPASERLRTGLGIAFYGNGEYQKAVPVFAGLLARDPNSSTAADLLGRSCSALGGAQQEGCTSLRRFAEAHPSNAPASLYAAITILHQAADNDNKNAAETLLRNALRVDPALSEAWYQLAVVQQSRGDWAGSADLLHHALQQKPDFPEAHYRLARAYSHMGRRDEADKEITLQQKFAGDVKAEEQRRMKEVTTFLITAN